MYPHVPQVVTGGAPAVEAGVGSSTFWRATVGWTCPLKRKMALGLPLASSQLHVLAALGVEVVGARLVVLLALLQRALVGATGVPVELASWVHGVVGGVGPAAEPVGIHL